MHKLPNFRLIYNNMFYQAVFDFINNNRIFSIKTFQDWILLCIYCTKDFLNQTLTLCINILRTGLFLLRMVQINFQNNYLELTVLHLYKIVN